MRRVNAKVVSILLILLLNSLCMAETIDVLIKGVDDGIKTKKQQDYKEAVMNAKLQAIERAGVKIQSITKVENFMLKYDMVESKAKALLLPGFKIMDLGYQQDGTYQVVLSGKVKPYKEGIENKELRYAKSLIDKGERSKVRNIITNIIESSKNDNAVAEALYYQVVWKFASDEKDTYSKLKAYYPNSKYVNLLDKFFVEKEQYAIDQVKGLVNFSVNAGQTSTRRVSVDYPDLTLSVVVIASLDKSVETSRGFVRYSMSDVRQTVSSNGERLRVRLIIEGQQVWSAEFKGEDIAYLGSNRGGWENQWENPRFNTPKQYYASAKWGKFKFKFILGSSGVRWLRSNYYPSGRVEKAYVEVTCIRETL